MPKVVLFDIDGTLVLTGRAGVRAMNRAGLSVLGVPDLLEDIQIAGRTDWSILRDATAKYGRPLDRELMAQLRAAYVGCLEEEIEHPGEGVKAVMPGIPELLTALDGRDDVLLGLLTGNFVDGARIKLEHFDLWRYFAWGAFGDDAEDRDALVPFALERARARGVCEVPYGDVFVIGDTPHDVACADAVGAVPIAVATGNYTVDELRGTGAAIVLRDLGDTAAVLDLLAR